MKTVVAQKISRVFGEGSTRVDAVRDVSLEVSSGEVLLLLGPSGSGKTTLVSILGGLLRPTAGDVTIAGRQLDPAAGRTDDFRLRNVGFIFQSFNLLPALNAVENVAIPLRLRGMGKRPAEDQAVELLKDLGMGKRLRVSPRVLSGGERQRVSVARALVGRPAVLLADEPTASLDTATGREAIKLIVSRAHAGGQACVVVTHDTRLTEFADRILYIEDGSIRPQSLS